MPYHPAILSVYEVGLRTIPRFPTEIHGLDTTRKIEENVTVTYEDVEYARNIVAAFLGDFTGLPPNSEEKNEAVFIAEMYRVAVESTYSRTTVYATPPKDSQNQIRELKDRIRTLESNLDRIGKETEERIAKAQASADNAQIVSRNSRLRYPQSYFPLKKTIPGSGLHIAQALCPENIDAELLAARTNTHPTVGSLPPKFDGQIWAYDDDKILMMIVFYNEDFGIGDADSLPVRIAKFKSYLSEFAKK